MIDRFWPPSEQHPPLSAIFMYLEGDLEDRESANLAQHLKDCWECRVQCEKLNRGIDAFMEYRRVVLLPSAPVPSGNLLRRRVQEVLAALPATSRFRRGRAASRVAVWIGAGLSAALFITVLAVPVARPPRLSAAELIQRTREFSILDLPRQSGSARAIALQKVELRLGDRVIERQIVLGQEHAATQPAPSEGDWERLLNGTPIDWGNPLGVERYEHWRETDGRGVDTVSEANGLATLTTIPDSRALVTSASLIVRESDWHAIAKRVEFAGHPALVIRELEFQMNELPPVKAASAAEPPPAPPRIPTEVAVILPPALPSLPTAAQIGPNQAEIEVREALHRVGADVEEVPEITSEGGEIRVQAFAQTPQRKQELLTSLRGIPHVTAEIVDPETVVDPKTVQGGEPSKAFAGPVYSTEPPLIAVLRDHLGGLDAANAYLHGVREAYRQTLVNTAALQKLGERYSGPEWESLPPQLRARVNQLAEDYITAVKKDSKSYLSQLSTGLDGMLVVRQLTPQFKEMAEKECGGAWQTGAESIAKDLRELETSFQRLFVVEKLDAPVTFSADGLLLDAAQLRNQLSGNIRGLCVPDLIH